MKKDWVDFLIKIDEKIEQLNDIGIDCIGFRGHSNSSWDLTPSILVKMSQNGIELSTLETLETRLYFDFVTNSGNLLRPEINPWEVLFEMRHHGVPTRVLDWSESFATV